MHKNNIPLVIKATSVCNKGTHSTNLVYVPDKEKGFVLQNSIDQKLKNQPAMVIEGNQFKGTIDEFKEAIKKLSVPCTGQQCTLKQLPALASQDIAQVILANAVEHPQFHDKNKGITFSSQSPLKKEFERMKNIAQKAR